jgi:hypothetical protein
MNWNQAKEQLGINLKKGVHFDPTSMFRTISEIPAFYKCRAYNYSWKNGFKIKIGTNNYIEIPWLMLRTIFEATRINNNIYNNNVFVNHYPDQAKDHPCHIHVVGQMFVKAGIAICLDASNFKLII